MKLAESYIDLYVFSIKLVPYGRKGYFHFFFCLSILFIMFKVQFQYLLYPVVYTHTHTHISLVSGCCVVLLDNISCFFPRFHQAWGELV